MNSLTNHFPTKSDLHLSFLPNHVPGKPVLARLFLPRSAALQSFLPPLAQKLLLRSRTQGSLPSLLPLSDVQHLILLSPPSSTTAHVSLDFGIGHAPSGFPTFSRWSLVSLTDLPSFPSGTLYVGDASGLFQTSHSVLAPVPTDPGIFLPR